MPGKHYDNFFPNNTSFHIINIVHLIKYNLSFQKDQTNKSEILYDKNIRHIRKSKEGNALGTLPILYHVWYQHLYRALISEFQWS